LPRPLPGDPELGLEPLGVEELGERLAHRERPELAHLIVSEKAAAEIIVAGPGRSGLTYKVG
jgi:hypothetical protein